MVYISLVQVWRITQLSYISLMFSIATQMVVGIPGMSFKYKEISCILFIDQWVKVIILVWELTMHCWSCCHDQDKRYLCSSILKPKWMIFFLLLLHLILLISSPINNFATNSKFVIILVFPHQGDPPHLKLMDRNSVTTFSHYSDTILDPFHLFTFPIVTNFHGFFYTTSEMFSELDSYFIVVCPKPQLFFSVYIM